MDFDVEALAEAPYRRESDAYKSERRSERSRSPPRDPRSHSYERDRSQSRHSHDSYRSGRGYPPRSPSRSNEERIRRRSPRDDYDRYRDRSPRVHDRRDYHHDRSRYHDRHRDHDYRRRDDDRYSRGREVPREPAPVERRGPRMPSPPLSEEERDARTIFVQQLAARLRTRELREFFEKAGPVREAQIVKDRISGRSKGVGYVEFKTEDGVQNALEMTGSKLLGIPVIVQLTEAEKNRQAREAAQEANRQNEPTYHRVQIGNIHFSLGEDDIRQVFEPFGEVEFVHLQKDPDTGRSRGHGYVQYRDASAAKDAYSKMNGFDLAGRTMRVSLGSEKAAPGTSDSTRNRYAADDDNRNESAASKYHEKSREPYISRDALMKKLSREEPRDIPTPYIGSLENIGLMSRPPVNGGRPSPTRCLLLRNLFDPAQESGDSWVQELEEDVKMECEEKYGKVVFIYADDNSQGDIYIKFASIDETQRALDGLDGRWFGGRTIAASFLSDPLFHAKCPKAKEF